jgi:hypothetical protein
VLFSTGLLQIALALSLRLMAFSLRRAPSLCLNARWMERACFAKSIVPHLAAFLLVPAIVVPQYIHHETNLWKERVGIVCVIAALLIAARYAYALTRVVGFLLISRQQGETAVTGSADGVPIQIVRDSDPLLAVRGFLSPRILVSRRLFEAVSPEALEVALAHERAHLRQLDNVKLLILWSLQLPCGSASALRRWRRAAEIAADHDAAGGSRRRAVLLAETLLASVRMGSCEPHSAVALGLLPHEEDLEDRIYRLLDDRPAAASVNPFSAVGTTLLALGTAALLLSFAIVPFHAFAEYLLHLG